MSKGGAEFPSSIGQGPDFYEIAYGNGPKPVNEPMYEYTTPLSEVVEAIKPPQKIHTAEEAVFGTGEGLFGGLGVMHSSMRWIEVEEETKRKISTDREELDEQLKAIPAHTPSHATPVPRRRETPGEKANIKPREEVIFVAPTAA